MKTCSHTFPLCCCLILNVVHPSKWFPWLNVLPSPGYFLFLLILIASEQNILAQGGTIELNKRRSYQHTDTVSFFPYEKGNAYQSTLNEIQNLNLRKEIANANAAVTSDAVQAQKIRQLEKKLYDLNKKAYSDRLALLEKQSLKVDSSLLAIHNRAEAIGEKDGNKSSIEKLYIQDKLTTLDKLSKGLKNTIYQIGYLSKDSLNLINDDRLSGQNGQADSLLKAIEAGINQVNKVETGTQRQVLDEIKGIPALTSPFIAGLIVPSASVVASREITNEKSGTEWRVNLFFAGNTTKDTTSLQSSNKSIPLTRLLIPEISNYGLKIQATRAFNLTFLEGGNSHSKNIGFIGQLNFLSKNINNADTADTKNLNVNTFFIHSKAGIEIAVVPDAISVYGLINGISSITQVQNFEQYFKMANKVFLFGETGIQASLNINGDNRNFLLFDLGLILKNDQLNTLSNDRDAVIPSIRIGYKAKLQ